MTENNQKEWFSDIETIVSEPLKFKAKLAIGEDAYTSLRIKNTAWEVWDVVGVAGTGVWAAKLPAVASLLGTKGILATIGLTATATPVGWVILAGVLSGGAWLGITRYLKSTVQDRVIVIPNFINTPLDVLALGLFDLIAPLAMKVANVDDRIDIAERKAINSYFVAEWGYDQRFVNEGLAFISSKLDDYRIKDLAQALAELQKQNPDCNYKSMSKEVVSFLKAIIESDGRIDEREEMAIENVKNIFTEVSKIKIKNIAKTLSGAVSDAGSLIKTKTGEAIEKSGDLASGTYDSLKKQGEKAIDFCSETYDRVKEAGVKSTQKAAEGTFVKKD